MDINTLLLDSYSDTVASISGGLGIIQGTTNIPSLIFQRLQIIPGTAKKITAVAEAAQYLTMVTFTPIVGVTYTVTVNYVDDLNVVRQASYSYTAVTSDDAADVSAGIGALIAADTTAFCTASYTGGGLLIVTGKGKAKKNLLAYSSSSVVGASAPFTFTLVSYVAPFGQGADLLAAKIPNAVSGHAYTGWFWTVAQDSAQENSRFQTNIGYALYLYNAESDYATVAAVIDGILKPKAGGSQTAAEADISLI
jgi:hypothetical protein